MRGRLGQLIAPLVDLDNALYGKKDCRFPIPGQADELCRDIHIAAQGVDKHLIPGVNFRAIDFDLTIAGIRCRIGAQ